MGNTLIHVMAFILTFLSIANAASLNDIQLQEKNGATHVDVLIHGPYTEKLFFLTNPNRLVLDLSEIKTFSPTYAQKSGGLIRSIRNGRPNSQTLRVVFEVTERIPFTSYKTSQGLHIKLGNEKSSSAFNPTPHMYQEYANAPETKILLPKPKGVVSSSQTRPIAVRSLHAPQRNLRDVIIVIDPGHGGKDPGAMGPSRSAEKHVVLAIAQKLKQLIDRQPGMKAVLTRNGDYYVGLRERLNIARKYNGDVFVSIHADAFINRNSSGASVFALSQRGATSEAARWIAEKENYSELGGVNLGDLDDRNGIIRTVLIDLSQTATISAGLQMGNRVLQNLDNITNLHNNKVEQARFVVLKSPDIPSILIETGFISNPREEKNLTSPAYQARLTQAIFNGLKRYFWDYPPQGSRIESLAKW
jgi:N-acetylmuramoyl-L-alanine amidase